MIRAFAPHLMNLLMWYILQVNSEGQDQTGDQSLCSLSEETSDVVECTDE